MIHRPEILLERATICINLKTDSTSPRPMSVLTLGRARQHRLIAFSSACLRWYRALALASFLPTENPELLIAIKD